MDGKKRKTFESLLSELNVSDVVRQLLLGKGFEFGAVGEAKLKGFDEAVTLYEVRAR